MRIDIGVTPTKSEAREIINHIKQFRRVATRHEKTARNFLAEGLGHTLASFFMKLKS